MKRLLSAGVLTLACSVFGVTVAAAPAHAATTHMSFNATPEPVHRGKAITVSGRVWTGAAKTRAGNSRTVKFYFRKDGTSAFVYKGSTTASPAGYYRRTFTARTTGAWSARVDRTPTKTPATTYDHVRVVVTTTLYKSWSGSGDWQSPRIYMPRTDYRAHISWTCHDPSGGFMYLTWDADDFGYEYASSSNASGSFVLYGHEGARYGYFEVSPWIDCSWRLLVYSGSRLATA